MRRYVTWETKQPQRLMARICGIYKRSHMSGSLYVVGFDELYDFVSTDPTAQKLIVHKPKSSGLNVVWGIVAGIVGGIEVLAYIAWGVMAAMCIGIAAVMFFSKKSK